MQHSKYKLALNALIKYFMGLVIVSLLLFIPAGTVSYVNGWLFIALLFIPMFFLGLILLIKSPKLLEKRLNSKEKRKTQSKVVAVSGIAFMISFLMAGIDYRFKLTVVPYWIVAAASVVLLISYGLYAEVMRENAYLSRTVEVQENQQVIDTGLYGIVRHPMYMATLLLFLSIPLVLCSWISFAIMLVYPIVIVARIKDEEQLLEKELNGYKEYKNKVKYRLIPFIW
ncbi:MAG: isoprenylcysteine carboxylmethyltransferase family protein [Ruminococcaceae bacterium]|nr:isoprenylcysteine carboxylmethyltransferase family protein [Oscillospiraceae bacterium]